VTIRLLLVEDQTIVRLGLRRLLETVTHLFVVGEAACVSEAVATEAALKPDVVIMDLKLGLESGLEAAKQIRAQNPAARILALTAYDDYPMVEEAIAVGFLGYAPKQIGLPELTRAIEAVAAGTQYIHPSILTVLLDGIRQQAGGRPAPPVVTDDEKTLLGLLAEGLSLAEIAAQTFVSERTVRRHVQTLFDRLGAANTTQAVAYAIRRGWL
jgi:DNA-binding NarL/FixJ family response regulator